MPIVSKKSRVNHGCSEVPTLGVSAWKAHTVRSQTAEFCSQHQQLQVKTGSSGGQEGSSCGCPFRSWIVCFHTNLNDAQFAG